MAFPSLDKLFKLFRGANAGPRNLLHNKYVLYVVFAIAILHLFFAAMRLDFLYCAVFILVGFLTSFFSKNMTVIMVITLALANIIRVILRGEPEFEGMEDGSGDAGTAAAETANAGGEESKDAQKPKEKETDANKKAPDADKTGASPEDESKMVNELKSDAQDLIDAQEKIIAGFGTIGPHMDAAENLINKINQTAKKIEGLRTGSSLTGGSSMKMEPFTEGAAVRRRTANAQGHVNPVANQPPQAPMPRNMVRALERARAAEGAHNKK